MDYKRRYNKFLNIIEEFIISPAGRFSEENGKLVITVSTICICLFISRPTQEIFELPKATEDIVGNIPIVEHWDDGTIEEPIAIEKIFDRVVYVPTSEPYWDNDDGWSGMAITASTIGYR